jgi:Mg2+-importing ATPase
LIDELKTMVSDRKARRPKPKANPLSLLLSLVAEEDADTVLGTLATTDQGLREEEAVKRLAKHGRNEIAHEKPPVWWAQLLGCFKNTFVVVLLVLGLVSFFTNDHLGALIIGTMVGISVVLRFWQEFRSSRAAERLKAMVRTTATVSRLADTPEGGLAPAKREIPMHELVPGDIIHLSAGDMIPADVRLLQAKDLFVSQSALTGESLPVEKHDTLGHVAQKTSDGGRLGGAKELLDQVTLCFLGTNIVSGSATAVVVQTGGRTMLGSLAKNVLGQRSLTSFDKGVNSVSWILVRFMLVMVPVVLLINGFTKGDWEQAFFFALAVAVGLTPEMLPLIVTANLARGAVAMSKKKVIVKRLNSIQNLGAMDVLCTDKTGTLTEDKVVLIQHLDVAGKENERVLGLAYLNSFHQTGLKNLIDRAVIAHTAEHHATIAGRTWRKIDEIPFDFVRRRMSVIVAPQVGESLLVCKGAVEEILRICTAVEIDGKVQPLTEPMLNWVRGLRTDLNKDGVRVIAVAYRRFATFKTAYRSEDEHDLVLAGFIGFLDPPKPSAAAAIRALRAKGVEVKIITGDNEVVTRKVCSEVGVDAGTPVLGHEIDDLGDQQLGRLAQRTRVFAKINPMQKARIIRALKSVGHTVGYLGDGINDAAALREADVGVSVDTAVDIAKESADIILLEKSLMVLEEGIIEGRVTFGNIMKYLKMTASSNFGNVFSVLVASAFIPFLPMLGIQLLIQNLLYEFTQLTIPWDRMDEEFLRQPRKWEAGGIVRFMIFIGPISSIFDITTFGVMWFVFHANRSSAQSMFQSGWFIEGLLSQTLIVHMIRTQRIPFLQSTASWPLTVSTIAVMALGIAAPFTPVGAMVGLSPLPGGYFLWLGPTLLSYCVLTQWMKLRFIRRFHTWL